MLPSCEGTNRSLVFLASTPPSRARTYFPPRTFFAGEGSRADGEVTSFLLVVGEQRTMRLITAMNLWPCACRALQSEPTPAAASSSSLCSCRSACCRVLAGVRHACHLLQTSSRRSPVRPASSTHEEIPPPPLPSHEVSGSGLALARPLGTRRSPRRAGPGGLRVDRRSARERSGFHWKLEQEG